MCGALLRSPVLGMIIVQDGAIVLANDATGRILGYDAAALRAMGADDLLRLVHPESRSAIITHYRQRLAGEPTPDSYEIQVLTREGDSRWLNLFPALIRFKGGQAVLVFFVDVTARVEAIGRLEANEDALRHAISSLREGRPEKAADLLGQAEAKSSELADANEYMSTLLSTSHDGILVVDAQGKFEYGNEAFFRTFGWPKEELIGVYFMKVVAPELHDYMLQRWAEVQAEQGQPYETVIIHKDGTRRALLVSHRHMTIAGQRKYCVITKDITDKKKSERELQAHRERLEDLVMARTAELTEANRRLREGERKLAAAQSIAHVGSWEWEPRTGRLQWSDEMYRLYGLEPGSPLEEDVLWAFCHPDDRPAMQKVLRRAVAERSSFEAEFRIVRRDGTVLYVLVRGQPVEAGHDPGVLMGTVLDITERRKLEHEVVQVARREQRRIGQDIHDVLGQELVGMSLMAKALEQRLEKVSPALAREARELAGMASHSASHARSLAHGLAPLDVAADSLAYELERMAARFSNLHGITCVCSIEGDGLVHDSAVAQHLYYIAREAITNAARHAGATCIDIHLGDGETGYLRVEDNGKWSEKPNAPDGGIGLRIMAHRADIIGAALRVDHGDGCGTCVTCEFPNPPL